MWNFTQLDNNFQSGAERLKRKPGSLTSGQDGSPDIEMCAYVSINLVEKAQFLKIFLKIDILRP